MTSLKEWLRNDLRYGSSYPSIEELAAEYIKKLEKHMRSGLHDNDFAKGYDYAVEETLKFLKGEK